MTTIRVLIVVRDPVTRQGLHATLHLANDLAIVGEADSGETAIERARELSPDVVFMDERVPSTGVIEATKVIKGASPETRVILLTDDEFGASVLEADRFRPPIQAGEGILQKVAYGAMTKEVAHELGISPRAASIDCPGRICGASCWSVGKTCSDGKEGCRRCGTRQRTEVPESCLRRTGRERSARRCGGADT